MPQFEQESRDTNPSQMLQSEQRMCEETKKAVYEEIEKFIIRRKK